MITETPKSIEQDISDEISEKQIQKMEEATRNGRLMGGDIDYKYKYLKYKHKYNELKKKNKY